MPAEVPLKRRFRVFSAVAILLLLGILLFSIYEPIELSDGTRKLLGWAAGAIVLAAVLVSWAMSRKLGVRNMKYVVELADGKLIQRRAGSAIVEIPLGQIESLHEGHGWLIVKGREQKRNIAIPKEINDFDALKQELTAHGTIVPLKVRISILSLLPIVLGVLLYVLFFTSHERGVVVFSGVAVLLFQGFASFLLLRFRRRMAMPKLAVLSVVISWLLIGWIIFQRMKAVL
ncbi:MAG: hypothetical protein ACLP1Y_06695 [Candidatus Acidiferrales bacterium]